MEVTGKRADSISEPCKACQIEGRCIQADGYCQECDENMCQKCFQHHVKGKLCRNHVMSPLGLSMLHGRDKSECHEKCRTHITENIKYYCREHDMITCGDCNVAEHQGCKIEFIGTVADHFENSSEFKAIFQQIEQLEIKNNESRTKIDNHRKENKMFLDKALSEIKNFRKELNDYLDRMEKEIVSEANNTSKENEELMSKLEMMTSKVQQDLDDLMNNLDSTIIHGNKLFIRTREYKPKLYKVEEQVSYIINNNLLKGFAFEQEEQLVEMVRSGIKLGCLRLETSMKNEQPAEPLKPELTMEVVAYEKDVEAKQKHIPSDVQKLQKICEQWKCEGNVCKKSPVEQTRSIQVACLSHQTNSDLLSLYFENKRRSHGGEVENAESTCKIDKHVIDGQTIEVKLHYASLELDDDIIVPIPIPILFDELDEYIRKFIKHSTKYRSMVENVISNRYGRVVWDAQKEDSTCIQIECTVNPKDRLGLEKVKDWRENCTRTFKEVTDTLEVQSQNISIEVWPELKIRLREISIPDPQQVAVILTESGCVVVVVGEKQSVRSVFDQIQRIVDDVEDKLNEQNKVITKKLRFKKYELLLVRAAKMEYKLKKDLEEFSMDLEKAEVTLEGKQKDVDTAVTKLRSMLRSCVSKPIPGFTKEAKELLFIKETSNYIKAKMIKEKIIGVWDVPRGFEVVMHSKNAKDVEKAVQIMQDLIKIDSIQIDPGVVQNEELVSKLKELIKCHEGFFLYSLQQDELRFVCVDQIYDDVKIAIVSFLDLNTIISQFVHMDVGTYSFIKQYKEKEVASIENQYSPLAVRVGIIGIEHKHGFKVRGKKDGCKLAINKLQQLIDSVARKDHKLAWPGFDKFLKSSEGTDEIKRIELREKCVLKVSFEDSKSHQINLRDNQDGKTRKNSKEK